MAEILLELAQIHKEFFLNKLNESIVNFGDAKKENIETFFRGLNELLRHMDSHPLKEETATKLNQKIETYLNEHGLHSDIFDLLKTIVRIGLTLSESITKKLTNSVDCLGQEAGNQGVINFVESVYILARIPSIYPDLLENISNSLCKIIDSQSVAPYVLFQVSALLERNPSLLLKNKIPLLLESWLNKKINKTENGHDLMNDILGLFDLSEHLVEFDSYYKSAASHNQNLPTKIFKSTPLSVIVASSLPAKQIAPIIFDRMLVNRKAVYLENGKLIFWENRRLWEISVSPELIKEFQSHPFSGLQ
jgi:hypothetical protein